MIMNFIDLQKQYLLHKTQIDTAIARVLQHGQFLFGPEISTLESKLSQYVGVKHCISMSSGTTALQVALMALDIQPGDEVITTPFSFFATAEVIHLLGAKPVYVDIYPDTYLLDVHQLEAAITSRTKAIIPVSLYGQCADMDVINAIAARYNIAVVEDAAQSFGATYKDKKSCGLSTIGCTSFFPSKPLGGYGDSGACFTNDSDLADKMRVIANHGQKARYHHVAIGINGRMDTIQAAVLLEKLAIFEKELSAREKVAHWYDAYLPSDLVRTAIASENTSVYAQYTIEVSDRSLVQKVLSESGIPSMVHYPVGLHEQPIVIALEGVKKNNFPVAEKAAQRVLSIPFHPYLEERDVRKIADQIVLALQSIIPV